MKLTSKAGRGWVPYLVLAADTPAHGVRGDRTAPAKQGERLRDYSGGVLVPQIRNNARKRSSFHTAFGGRSAHKRVLQCNEAVVNMTSVYACLELFHEHLQNQQSHHQRNTDGWSVMVMVFPSPQQTVEHYSAIVRPWAMLQASAHRHVPRQRRILPRGSLMSDRPRLHHSRCLFRYRIGVFPNIAIRF